MILLAGQQPIIVKTKGLGKPIFLVMILLRVKFATHGNLKGEFYLIRVRTTKLLSISWTNLTIMLNELI